MKLTNGLDEKQVLDQANKIAEINDKVKLNQPIEDQKNHQLLSDNFRILSSVEINI